MVGTLKRSLVRRVIHGVIPGLPLGLSGSRWRGVGLVLAVLLLHGLSLHGLALSLQPPSVLKAMPQALLTRQLLPTVAPPAPALQAPAVVAQKTPSEAAAATVTTVVTAQPDSPSPTPPPPAPPEASPAPAAPAELAALPASPPPESAASAMTGQAPVTPATDSVPSSVASTGTNTSGAEGLQWPPDTRLHYRVSGQFRGGPMYGDAQVLWQRNGNHYQVRVEVNMSLFVHFSMTSQGEVRADGLYPTVYEEEARGSRRSLKLDEKVLRLMDGQSAPRPAHVQDTASQFVELTQRFQSGRAALVVGGVAQLWLARPNGANEWTYDIVAREPVNTGLGVVDAFHLLPRPLAQPRGNSTAEMWFAPTLQYLPVRIRLNLDSVNFIDLITEKIEQ